MAGDAVLIATAVLTLLALVASVVANYRASHGVAAGLHARFDTLQAAICRSGETLNLEFARSRDESGREAKLLREEVMGSFGRLADSLRQLISEQGSAQKTQLELFAKYLSELKADTDRDAKEFRETVQAVLKDLGDTAAARIGEIGAAQKERLDNLSLIISTLSQQTADKQEALRRAVEGRLDAIRTENAEKLEQMRVTVDEKLQSTLEQRLGASFKQVSESLEQVYKSVGEMQVLAGSVGDLKKVLTNVKSRGTWGEVALGNLLEQMLAPEQYDRNVEVLPGSNQRVEFAIRLPGDEDVPVWLPVDAKFPMEDYERLSDASEHGDAADVEAASRAVEARIRMAARDISAKYVHPPHSTDFAVLYLPTEGLFAEAVRRPGLVDLLQREYRIMVAGPTTLATLLTALRMGFRSLAIQRRSKDVWRVLGAVKSEFSKFGDVMDRVSKKLSQAQKVIDDEVGPRRRAMDRQLRELEALPQAEAVTLLGLESVRTSLLADEVPERLDAAE